MGVHCSKVISTCPVNRIIAPDDAAHYADTLAATSVRRAPACLPHHTLWSIPWSFITFLTALATASETAPSNSARILADL